MTSISTQKASSSSSTPRWKYDVFLSFRGKDTRNNFTDHLYAALKLKGIFTFRDDEKLVRGKSISLELLKAIEESRFAIVILSKNYASSSWCLDELVKIIECMKEIGMIVLPVFYNVDPSDVRKQTGTFAEAFVEHEERFKENIQKVQKWRAALIEVANLSGWHLQDRPESYMVQSIVKMLWDELTSNSFSENIEDFVGLVSRGEKLESYLNIGLNDVRIIGVWGMGGIGKTTLARVVFRTVSNKFEGCCFLDNVREVSEKHGLVRLQQQLILQILNESMSIHDVDHGTSVIKNRLRHKRILLILDDVNQLDQLNKLAGNHIWFGSGSRVIITTRDKHLLKSLDVDGIYEVDGLNDDEALHLMSLKAFKKDYPPRDYLELSKDFVYYANGLPLAIEILGSLLFDRSIGEWKSALDRLKEFPIPEIQQVLKISFDGLHVAEKEIFLNMACFFNHADQDSLIEILDYLELYPKIGLNVLIEKSLIKLQYNHFWMHDLLQEMGRNIVHQECPTELGQRSKLWLLEDINNVLTNNSGTKAIQGIVLKLPKPKEAYWNPESLSKIHHLKLLIIDNVHLLHDLKHLPNALRFLDWSGYPSKSFPPSLQLKSFERLKSIRLSKSLKLTKIADFTKVPVLEKLVLEDCINLCEIHPSIGVHEKLTLLNLKGCENLKSLPNKLEMKSLEVLILSNCSKVKRIPEFGENMECVSELYLDGTSITKLPTSIGNLIGLASLSVRDCKSLMSLPSTLFNLKSLKNLDLFGCSKLGKLLENLGIAKSVEELDVSGTSIGPMLSLNALFITLKKLAFGGFIPRNPNPMGVLSTSLAGLCSLTQLNLSYCKLNAIPNDICCLFSLERLDLSGNNFGCLPEGISQLSILRHLTLENCTSLRSLPKLPLNIGYIWGFGCTSLETVQDLLKPNSSIAPILHLSDCNKLAENKGFIDMYFAVMKRSLKGLSLDNIYQMVIPGSEILEWFRHQSRGTEVHIKEPSSHLCNEWMGIAVSVVFCYNPHQFDYSISFLNRRQTHYRGSIFCWLIVNGKKMSPAASTVTIGVLSDHIWLLYFLPQYREKDIKSLWERDVSGFGEIGIRIKTHSLEVKKCGLRMVYKKDIEDLNGTMAQSSNDSIIPYEGLDIPYHNSDNSTVVMVGNKAKRNRDDSNGAGPSGEGSSNDIPNPKRIERLP